MNNRFDILKVNEKGDSETLHPDETSSKADKSNKMEETKLPFVFVQTVINYLAMWLVKIYMLNP